MKKEFNSFVKSIFIYGFGNVSVKIIGLILLPLYSNTDLLTVEEYATMGILDISSQVLVSLFSLALSSAYFRWYFDKEHIGQRKSIFFTCFATLTGLAIMLASAGVFGSKTITGILFGSASFSGAFSLMIVATSMQPIIDFTLAQMRSENKASFFVTSNVTKLVVSLVATIFFLKFTDKGLSGIYLAQITGNVVFLLLTSRYIFRNFEFRFLTPTLISLLKYSLPLALASVSSVLLVVVDRYVLNFKSSDLNLAMYTQGYKIANTTKVFVVSSIQLAMAPAIFKIMNRPDNKLIYSRIMTWFTIVVAWFALFMSLFGLEITKLFTTDKIYFDAYKIIPFFSLSIIFGMLKDVSLTGLQIMKKTKIIGLTLTLVAAFNLMLNMILVPVWDIYGAALSSTVSQLIFFIIMFMAAQKSYKIPYRLDKVFIIIISAAVLFVAGNFFNEYNLGIRVLVKFSALILFPVSLFVFSVIDRDEINMVMSLFNNIKSMIVSGRKEDLPPVISGSDEN